MNEDVNFLWKMVIFQLIRHVRFRGANCSQETGLNLNRPVSTKAVPLEVPLELELVAGLVLIGYFSLIKSTLKIARYRPLVILRVSPIF